MNDTNQCGPLFVGCPNQGDRGVLLARINDLLDRRWFTNNGPLVQEFEQRIADYVGVRHCVAMCNATVALEIASHALGFAGEVIVPAYTFVATVHALQWQGIRPVFADINPATYNIEPGTLEKLITPKTTGIVGVHVWGRACDVEAIETIAAHHHLQVLFDAAHAFGCSYRGRMVGGFGRCEVFSFHATKFLNSFEGGAVTTNDAELAEKLRLMRNFGFSGYDNVIYQGVNGKMTEVCAAMGLTSLEAVDAIVATNCRNYDCYCRFLADIPGVAIIAYDPLEKNNYQYIIVEIDEQASGVSRDGLVTHLHSHGIIARKYFWPGVHRMEPYRTLQPDAGRSLPNTEQVSARVIVLPTGQAVDEVSVAWVCHVIRDFINCGHRPTGNRGTSPR
ncbi:DegT/DnrJ/EryC1/StrS aminotransferase family protein [uncultured Thiodictyon sp.]|jgi:dTDP-4-amino-4,6-dideoxygalactose transaminase|uniref:DegT/DnrJ/EryC1/StrS family aminotransferase n=1 Tax=uncultured Thiodictyon sp. TaxID=1846217 RepID=UPI0025E07A38|nr:DegT/DnrJ/EryC1/StrS family aminotransferase [uncultured Thiodictyon sp.]